jgi:hypothetical protein
MLSVLAALGCGFAAVQGDLLFVAIFGAACAVTIIEAVFAVRCKLTLRRVQNWRGSAGCASAKIALARVRNHFSRKALMT